MRHIIKLLIGVMGEIGECLNCKGHLKLVNSVTLNILDDLKLLHLGPDYHWHLQLSLVEEGPCFLESNCLGTELESYIG